MQSAQWAHPLASTYDHDDRQYAYSAAHGAHHHHHQHTDHDGGAHPMLAHQHAHHAHPQDAYYSSATSSTSAPMNASYAHDDYLKTHSLSPSQHSYYSNGHHSYSASSYPSTAYNHPQSYSHSPTRYVHSSLPSPLYSHDVHDESPPSAHYSNYDNVHHAQSHAQEVPSPAAYNSYSYGTPVHSPHPSRISTYHEDVAAHPTASHSPVVPLQYHESRTSADTPRFASASYPQAAIASPLVSSPTVQLNVSNARSHYADDSEDELSEAENGGRTDAYAALRAATASSGRLPQARMAEDSPLQRKIKLENESRTIYNPVPITSRRTRNSMSAASNAFLEYYPRNGDSGRGYTSPQHSPTGNSSSTASSFATDSSFTRPPSVHSSPASSSHELDNEYLPLSHASRPLTTSKLGNPVPVPNLTKKSRGRHVPTTPFVLANGISKNVRLHTCTVEGCGKCFARGEHLKRHVRSIHTNEKPFKCLEPDCSKSFSRHDNLNQHMRVHKNYSAPLDGGY